MPKRSAGLLVWRRTSEIEVFLAHPGGPLHARKDVWGIPKGEYEADEEPLVAAYREYAEEIGAPAPAGEALALGEVKQKGRKLVVAWAVKGSAETVFVASNLFGMPWRGRWQEFPEIDRAEWFDVPTARLKINPAQEAFLDRLLELL